MTPATSEHYVLANEVRIFYREAGAGPPVVLLHGGLATGGIMWSDDVVVELARRHRVLIPDARGHGRTDDPAGSLRYDGMADDVAAFCEAVGAERPVIVGYSDGAQIALEVGLRHPGLATALVLGGVVTRPSDDYLGMVRGLGFPAPGTVDLAQVERAMGGFYPTLRTAHEHARDDAAFVAFLERISALWHGVPSYTDAQLAGIGTPSLVIAGDRDHPALDESLRLYGLLPRGELAVIPNTDHGAAESPLFWNAVADFLARHASGEPGRAAAHFSPPTERPMPDHPIPELARRYFRVYQAADREALEALLAPNFTFTSPWDDHIDRATYFSHCFPHAGSFRFREDMKIFAQGDEAFVMYETEGKPGGTFRNTELLRFEDGRIVSIEVFFGFIPGARPETDDAEAGAAADA